MKKIIIALICAVLINAPVLVAQNHKLTTSGTIEFTKTINMYAILKKGINKGNENIYGPAFEQYKDGHLQFTTLASTLTFSANQTLFKPVASGIISAGFFEVPQMVLQNNSVYTDHTTGHYTSQKAIFEDTYLLKDSLHKIRWKLTDEVREIAGYTCRRANALLLDSIYVVAFYTDQIPVPGGPESFHGLPGMILQVAIPHENISWVATKVIAAALPEKAITPPTKGKQVDQKTLINIVKELSEKRGNNFVTNLKAFLL